MIVVCGLWVRYDTGIMIAADKIPNDTSVETERAYLCLLRDVPLWRKAAMVNSLTKACQELAIAGIRMRHPDISDVEVRMRLAALWLDRDMMVRIFNWDPMLEGY
jgi:hypothetical protein